MYHNTAEFSWVSEKCVSIVFYQVVFRKHFNQLQKIQYEYNRKNEIKTLQCNNLIVKYTSQKKFKTDSFYPLFRVDKQAKRCILGTTSLLMQSVKKFVSVKNAGGNYDTTL